MSDTIVAPGFDDSLEQIRAEVFTTLNCIQVGRIVAFDKGNQTANVEIQLRRRRNETEIAEYPVLQDCPVFVLQGGGAYIDLPIAARDYCIVLFNDRNIDTWWSTANVAEPPNRRKHALSDGIAIVGINPRTSVRDIDGSIVRILGTSGPGGEEPAARQKDTTGSSAADDATFWNWVTTISAAVNGLAPGSVPTVPTSQTGQITGGSSEVFIG